MIKASQGTSAAPLTAPLLPQALSPQSTRDQPSQGMPCQSIVAPGQPLNVHARDPMRNGSAQPAGRQRQPGTGQSILQARTDPRVPRVPPINDDHVNASRVVKGSPQGFSPQRSFSAALECPHQPTLAWIPRGWDGVLSSESGAEGTMASVQPLDQANVQSDRSLRSAIAIVHSDRPEQSGPSIVQANRLQRSSEDVELRHQPDPSTGALHWRCRLAVSIRDVD